MSRPMNKHMTNCILIYEWQPRDIDHCKSIAKEKVLKVPAIHNEPKVNQNKFWIRQKRQNHKRRTSKTEGRSNLHIAEVFLSLLGIGYA